jgi:hypothetical protein
VEVTAFAVVVRIEEDLTHCPLGPFQRSQIPANANKAATLRRELAERAQKYAQAEGLPHCLSYGEAPTVCFAP